MQDILHFENHHDREDMRMTWILLAALVSVVALSVKDQLRRERDAYCVSMLTREYSL